MLFQRVNPDQLDQWSNAMSRAGENVNSWRDVVGVEGKRRQEDSSLFRVLEWGGMEVI